MVCKIPTKIIFKICYYSNIILFCIFILEPGVHSAYVNGYDANDVDKGPLFEIPITVVRPEPLIPEPRPHIEHNNVGFNPGEIKRHFVKAPNDATWAVVRYSIGNL